MTQDIDLGGDDEYSIGDTVRFTSVFGNEITGTVADVCEDELIINPGAHAPFWYAKDPSEVEHT